MAKATSEVRKQNKVDLDNLSQRDKDILKLETKDVMKKYKLGKQGVYDRRFALNKKIRSAGLTVEQVTGKANTAEPETVKVQPKKAKLKKTSKRADAAKSQDTTEENIATGREVMVVSKQVPIIMKPIEINFENFSIKLNGVPKKISVNPDTNAIEIDL